MNNQIPSRSEIELSLLEFHTHRISIPSLIIVDVVGSHLKNDFFSLFVSNINGIDETVIFDTFNKVSINSEILIKFGTIKLDLDKSISFPILTIQNYIIIDWSTLGIVSRSEDVSTRTLLITSIWRLKGRIVVIFKGVIKCLPASIGQSEGLKGINSEFLIRIDIKNLAIA